MPSLHHRRHAPHSLAMPGLGTLRNLARRKLRSVLTVAGIAIGIVALVVFGAMANQLDTFVGSNVQYLKGTVTVSAETATHRTAVPISPSSLKAIEAIPGVARAVPYVQFGIIVKDEMEMTLVPDSIVGVDTSRDATLGAYRPRLSQGRELTASDANSRVAVLGSDIALRNGKRLGDTMTVQGVDFTVVGIYGATTAMPDTEMRVPIAIARPMFVATLPEQYRAGLSTADLVTKVTLFPAAGVSADELAARVNAAGLDVQTMTSTSINEDLGSITKIFNAILMGVALLSLLIGGLSIVNTMAMAVAERTREIGIKRAIGGSRARVVHEIVSESATIGLIGGLVGLSIGAFITAIGNELGRSTNTILFDLTPQTALTALLFATVLGAIAGFVPALNASRLDPVTALRYE